MRATPWLVLWQVPFAALLVALLVAGGCFGDSDRLALSAKAKLLWEQGQYADAARNFVTLAELHPNGPLAEESLFWAANLYHHFLQNPAEAIRNYQQLLVQFTHGPYAEEARENLAGLYELDKGRRHRALQIYQQMLLSDRQKDRRDYLQFKIGGLNLKMGIMDQARFEFRSLITQFPRSPFLPEAYYLVGYSYFLEERFPLALVALNQVGRDFPGTPLAMRAQFFAAEILEEQGLLKEALAAFRGLEGKYEKKKILSKRIASLKARKRRSVR